MASSTKVKKIRKAMKAKKRGADRKAELRKKGSTPSKAAFFGESKSA